MKVETNMKKIVGFFYNVDPHLDDIIIFVYLNIDGKNTGKIVEI